MSFDTQTWRKQLTLLKHALRLQEVANGVFVQRIPARYLARLYDDDDSEDPVVDALRNLDDIFASCREALVDMSSSVEALLSVHEADKQSHGFVLLAWRLSFDAASRQMAECWPSGSGPPKWSLLGSSGAAKAIAAASPTSSSPSAPDLK